MMHGSDHEGEVDLSLVGQITAAIADDIICGRLEPGQRIRHQELTRRFGASFGSIREALLKVEHLRLVSISPRRGARVAVPSIETIEDLFAIRSAVYPVLVRGAILRGSDEELRRFADEATQLVRMLLSDVSSDAITDQSNVTGARLAEAAKMPWPNEILYTTLLQFGWFTNRLSLGESQERQEAASAWDALTAAIRTRDLEASDVAARRMLRRGARAVMHKLYEQHGLTRDEIARRLAMLMADEGPRSAEG
ncbi:MAG: GntR family transcriptional regulator [Alphaproteobacteria bacterium]|nr:GntR family transcriptional regulator [Alphaproteobacteria bacterium]